jgi:hypothetical protein
MGWEAGVNILNDSSLDQRIACLCVVFITVDMVVIGFDSLSECARNWRSYVKCAWFYKPFA